MAAQKSPVAFEVTDLVVFLKLSMVLSDGGGDGRVINARDRHIERDLRAESADEGGGSCWLLRFCNPMRPPFYRPKPGYCRSGRGPMIVRNSLPGVQWHHRDCKLDRQRWLSASHVAKVT